MKNDIPMTPALRQLRAANAEHQVFQYAYEPHGGTAQCARELGIDEHNVIKTIVLKADGKSPLIALMHGDCEISTKNLARAISAKTVELCEVAEAQRYSGYFVGGTSPFGFRRQCPVYAEATIFGLDWIVINAGARGLFVKIKPQVLADLLRPAIVEIRQ